MGSASRHRAPWIFWPIAALWDLVAFILSLTGRLIGIVIAFIFMVVGIILMFTLVGAIIGIPLFIIGFLLIVRSIF
ncbi:hypothetical protein ACFL40_03515 [candidate division KSB1 bacterium]